MSSSAMTHLRSAAVLTIFSCLSIPQFYSYFGGSTRGRDVFRRIMVYILPNEDENAQVGGLILLVFAMPLLVASGASILSLSWSSSYFDGAKCRQNSIFETKNVSPRSTMYAPNETTLAKEDHCLLTSSKKTIHKHNSVYTLVSKPLGFAIIFILIPCLFFYASNISRHYALYKISYNTSVQRNQTATERLYVNSNTTDYDLHIRPLKQQLLQHIANDSAIMALLSMAFLLVPISKHSPLVLLAKWSPVEAVSIHKWAGRLGILGVVVHGGLHLSCGYWRWRSQNAENDNASSFSSIYLPPWICWKDLISSHSTRDYEFEDLGFGCHQESSTCQCYDYFINLTGLIGMLALIVLGCSSVGYVRRHHYEVFYILHITAGPCFMIMVLLHYNKAILYFCPSLLYYASTSIPTYVQNYMQRKAQDKGTRIQSITRISCPTTKRPDAAVWDLVFQCTDESYEQFRAGQNCLLLVPQISVVAHPFTVNKVPGYSDRLRLLIRETGPFTNQLGKCIEDVNRQDELESQSLSAQVPPMHISGFYGSSHRMDQLRSHDYVIMIAGGIGITPYLSLLNDVVYLPSCSTSIELHWVCRDISLIGYIRDQYFSAMLQHSSSNEVSVKIVIHYTGGHEYPNDGSLGFHTKHFTPTTTEFYAMKHSMFSLGVKQPTERARRSFLAFSLIFSFGLWLVWYFFARVQTQEDMMSRLFSLFFVIASSISMSIGLLHIPDKTAHKTHMSTSEIKNNYASVGEQNQYHTRSRVSYEHQTGRPNLNNLLAKLGDASNPAVFSCGTRQMLESIRQAAVDCNLSRVDFFEEFFGQ